MRKLCLFSVFAVIGFLFAAGMAPKAKAAFYKYIDRYGGVHFTDRYESIPQEYRDQVQTLQERAEPEPAEKPAVKGDEKTEPKDRPAFPEGRSAQEAVKRETEEKARAEKEAEERKQKAFTEKVKRIEELQKEIENRQQELKGLRTTWMVYDRQAVFRINQEISDLRKEIERIQEEIAELK